MPKKQKNSKNGGLGNALRKSKNRKKIVEKVYYQKHGEERKEIEKKAQLESCTEQSGLKEFLYEAELAQKKFEGIRNTQIIVNTAQVIFKKKKIFSGITEKEKREEVLKNIKFLKIPKRPDWHNKTIEQQQLDENNNFITWRKELKKVEENFPGAVITPYEKNLEVWKQLWRVVEKSDVVVQIVDCRNPFFFRCEDVEHYVKEVSEKKENFLILNKADLLPERVRIILSNDLNEKKIQHIFFSAKDEQEKIDLSKEEIINKEWNDVKELKQIELNTPGLINREEILQIFLQFMNIHISNQKKEGNLKKNQEDENKPKNLTEKITIGMVGFPNVGKSSLINVLCGEKMVGVDAKPGKTKNFQTIYLTKEIKLCDCPGLVFPSIVSSKGEMICNGVLPLISLGEFLAPMKYLLSKVPVDLIVRMYKLPIEGKNMDKSCKEADYIKKARTLLQIFAGTKGYLTGGSGIPDESKAARLVINDFITGKMMHFTVPKQFEGEIDQIYNEFTKEFYPLHIQIPIKGVKKEDLIINEFADMKFQDKIKIQREVVKEESDYFFEHLTENDIMDLIESKRVMGKKLTKGQRRELKFMIKNTESEQKILNLLNSFLFNGKAMKAQIFNKK